MKILLIGANNPETLRMINACRKADPGIEFAGFLDNDPAKAGKEFLGLPVLGDFSWLKDKDISAYRFINLITRDCITRYTTSLSIAKLGGRFVNFIHPFVNLEMVKLGLGNYIQEGVILQAEVEIGNNSSIHMGTLVGHETKIGNSVFIAHGCNLSGCLQIEDGVFMGTGTSIVPRTKIGKWSVIGAGSVIIKDVPPYSVVVGNPGKPIKTIEHLYDSGNII
jgi:sugar O-acyltransferase (sialic acid O-acetyltransferase NeuD family)